MWRWAALWAALFAAYAATLAVDALPGVTYGAPEAANLAAARSLADGRFDDTHPLGFALLLAPLGDAAALAIAAVAALAFVLAAALARQVVADPWAIRATLAVGLSAPGLVYATSVTPEVIAGALLVAAALLAARVHEHPRRRDGLAAAALLALLPWLDAVLLIAAIPVLIALVHWTSRRGRKVLALLEVEIVAGSLVAFASVNDALYGSLTPPGEPGGGAGRAWRLIGVWLDRDYGLLPWAPVAALAGFGAVLLWRSRRDGLARVLPGRGPAEAAAALCAAAIAGVVLAAVAGAAPAGEWFPGRRLVPALPLAVPLVAWAWQRAPRAGTALVALTALVTIWVLVDGGGWGTPSPGPLPRFASGSPVADALTAGAIAAVVALIVRERRRPSSL